jgi:hypothetical protein
MATGIIYIEGAMIVDVSFYTTHVGVGMQAVCSSGPSAHYVAVAVDT